MGKKKKSWREKLLDSKDLPKVVEVTGAMRKKWGEGTCAIAAPIEIDALMRRVPEGRLTTINHLREQVAKKHKATFACPITTGIFSWIAAHAAEESAAAGDDDITPYWRTLKTGGELNPKYPGGIEAQRARLEAEGHRVIAKGKRWVVESWSASLFAFPSARRKSKLERPRKAAAT